MRLPAMGIATALVAGLACCADRPQPKSETKPVDARPVARSKPRPAPKASKLDLPARVRRAIVGAHASLCRIAPAKLRHDTAVGLAHVHRRLELPAHTTCWSKIRGKALADGDHPLNVLIDPTYHARVNIEAIRRRKIPGPKEPRVNVNTIVFRATHCKRAGFPDAAWSYLKGPMRDRGGFHSTHALWALIMLKERGCRTATEVDPVLASLRAELKQAQRVVGALSNTIAIDLYAERILFLRLSGVPTTELIANVRRLLKTQRKDGAFAGASDDRLRFVQHATTAAAWALAEVYAGFHSPR